VSTPSSTGTGVLSAGLGALVAFTLVAGAQTPAPSVEVVAIVQATPTPTPTPTPALDIWLLKLQPRREGFALGSPVRLTDREAYQNQPAFSPDGKVLYWTAHNAGQTDVVGYEIETRQAKVVRETPESEYSPQVLPDGSGLSVVRVEPDGTQRLWALPWSGAPYPIFERVKPVGYYAWGDADRAALFVLPGEGDADQPTLRLASRKSGKAEIVFRGAGRSIQRSPGREAIAFTGFNGSECWIREVDLGRGHVTSFARCLEKSMDFAWTPDGTLLMASGNRLFRHQPGADDGWLLVKAFAEPGLQAITRLAVSPKGDRLALVSERKR
jgi:hypothetical protein